MNLFTGYCIGTVSDDRYGLGVQRFHGHVDVYMSLLFFLINSPITVIVNTFLDEECNAIHFEG